MRSKLTINSYRKSKATAASQQRNSKAPAPMPKTMAPAQPARTGNAPLVPPFKLAVPSPTLNSPRWIKQI